jgi:hypothetical protein
VNRTSTLLALLCLVASVAPAATYGAVAATEAPGRWLPESCQPRLELAAAAGDVGASEDAETRWNRHYRRGYEAIESGDLETAELSLCQALEAARAYGARDLRFAETLDELGLLNFLRGDDARAEAMQGAAASEILLALGPPADDLIEEERDLCRSSVATYVARLGQVLERQGRAELIAKLERAPYLVLDRGYVPAPALEPRLEWLISRYLLAEDMAAADWLTALRERLRAELARD